MQWSGGLTKVIIILFFWSPTLVASRGVSHIHSFVAVARFSLLQPWWCCVGEVINPTSNYQHGLGGGTLHQKLIWLQTLNALGHRAELQITLMISFLFHSKVTRPPTRPRLGRFNLTVLLIHSRRLFQSRSLARGQFVALTISRWR